MWRFTPPSESRNDDNWNKKQRELREEKEYRDSVRYSLSKGNKDPNFPDEKKGRYVNLDGSRSSW